MSALEECYYISEKYVKGKYSKEVIKTRLKRIKELNISNPHQSRPKSPEETFTKSLVYLAKEGLNSSPKSVFELQSEINEMSDCAEKNYLLALLELRAGRNDSGCANANKYLTKAISQSPNDPRIRMLATILESVYEAKL